MFMTSFFDEQTNLPHATYDLWEEKFLTTSYSTAMTFSALKTGARLAELFNYPDDNVAWLQAAERIEDNMEIFFDPERSALRKGFLLQRDGEISFDNTLDSSSMYGFMMFGPDKYQDKVKSTVKAIEDILQDKSPSGGLPRYEHDNYMWRTDEALGNPWFICSFWMAQYYHDQGNSERAHQIMEWAMSKTTASGIFSEQIDPMTSEQVGVSPLVWSHAEFINTALDLANL